MRFVTMMLLKYFFVNLLISLRSVVMIHLLFLILVISVSSLFSWLAWLVGFQFYFILEIFSIDICFPFLLFLSFNWVNLGYYCFFSLQFPKKKIKLLILNLYFLLILRNSERKELSSINSMYKKIILQVRGMIKYSQMKPNKNIDICKLITKNS